MELKTLLIFAIVFNLFNNYFTLQPINGILPKEILNKNPIVPLVQLILTAKLLKDYHSGNRLLEDKLKSNYLLFLGKGNIQFENHQLDIANTTELIEEPEITTSTETYEDLAKNKHLLKFVARNGYQVWKRMLVLPSKANEDIPLNKTIVNKSTINNPTNVTSIKYRNNEKLRKKLKNLYKPDLQMIETENGFIEHKVSPPKWVENIINNGTKSPKTSTKLNSIVRKVKTPEKKSYKKEKNISTKYKIANSEQNQKPMFGVNNKIGKVVIKGFNGLFRGIGSLFGLK